MRFSSLATVHCLLCKDNDQEGEDGSVSNLKQICVGAS